MTPHRQTGIGLCTFGLIAQLFGAELTIDALIKQTSAVAGAGLLILSFLLLLIGGPLYVRRKGYHPAVGIAAVVPLLGLLVMIFLPSLSRQQEEVQGFEVLPARSDEQEKD